MRPFSRHCCVGELDNLLHMSKRGGARVRMRSLVSFCKQFWLANAKNNEKVKERGLLKIKNLSAIKYKGMV